MSSAYDQGLECYAARYEDLLKGYCAGDLQHCDWKGLREHHAEHGKAEGRVKSCRAWDTQCYAMRYPDLRRGYCKSGSAALDCDWLPLLRHWSSAGRAQGMQLDCETPELLCYAGRYPDLRSSFCSGRRIRWRGSAGTPWSFVSSGTRSRGLPTASRPRPASGAKARIRPECSVSG